LTTDKTNEENMTADAAHGGETEGQERFDHDGTWKDLIKKYFYPLLKRALPELYEAADRNKEPIPLDKEFRDVLNTADPAIHTSPHFADYVINVPLKGGGEEWILFHIEVQARGVNLAKRTGNLAERINHYRCFIYAHYRKEPVTLAIITYKRSPNEPAYYRHSHFGTEILYKYNNLVLDELDDDELMSSDNPIDIILYAAKHAALAKDEHQKLNFLRKLIELLDERGWSLLDKRDLFLFMERVVNIKDKELIGQFREFMDQRNKEGNAMYVPLLLRDSAEEIEQRGIDKGKLELARSLLARGISPDIIAESAGLPQEKIRELMN
jgi:predicted transposase/invertase (TIGR01784 family)